MSFGIGGFAEDENAVDGDYEAFNYCVAETYYEAMLEEDFDLLGDDVSFSLIENIAYWLGYCDELAKQNKNAIRYIMDGTLMTVNNRTFIDAVIEKRRLDIAQAYIFLGSMDVRLYILHMFLYEDEFNVGTIEEYYDGTILNSVCFHYTDRETIVSFLSNFFLEVEDIYNKLDNKEKRIMFLNVIRDNVKKIRYSEEIDKIYLDDVCHFGFTRVLLNK